MIIACNTDAEFNALVKYNRGSMLLLVFGAPWCAPCKALAPVLERFCAAYPSALAAKLDVERCPETTAMIGVRGLPTVMVVLAAPGPSGTPVSVLASLSGVITLDHLTSAWRASEQRRPASGLSTPSTFKEPPVL